MPPTKDKEGDSEDTKLEDAQVGKLVLTEKNYYAETTQKQRDIWEELWKLYIGKLPPTKNQSLSRNFIPKTHQAVELMASFLVGNQPSIFAIPVGEDDEEKATFIGRLLEFQWQHVLEMKPKTLAWAKSAILFGVGVMKVGWDPDIDDPFAYPVNIGDFYTDPYERNLQNAHSVIERIVLPKEQVEKNYDVKGLVPMKVKAGEDDNSTRFDDQDMAFGAHDQNVVDRVELFERWTKDEVVTIVTQPRDKEDNEDDEKVGMVIKRRKNPYGFIPYVSLHYKDSPLPNRFYTIGAIEPVAKVHKRMNQIVNQIVDNVNLIMSPPAVIRRGAGVDPRDIANLLPGKVIDTLGEPERDLQWVVTPDTTRTGYNLYQTLDAEFQRGTSVTDIRTGGGSADTATEAAIQQSNLNTQTSLVKENVEYAVGQLGQMLAKLNIQNITNIRSFRIFEPEEVFEFERAVDKRPNGEDGFPLPLGERERKDIRKNGRVFKIDKGDLDGEYDIRVKGDSTLLQNRDILRKQLIDFTQFLASIGVQLDTNRIADKWGEISGIPNASQFIKEEPELQAGPAVGPGGGQSLAPPTTGASTSEGVTGRGIEASVQNDSSPLTQ